MLRLILTVILVIAAGFLYAYFQELNSGSVKIWLGSTVSVDLSPAFLILLSMATGALIVTLLVGVRETKHLILNWKNNRYRRREEKITTLHREGTHAFLSKQVDKAADFFEKALTLDPHRADTLLWLGNLHRLQGNFTEAIRLLRNAQGKDGQNLEVFLDLAKDLEEAHRFEEALEALQGILKVDPSPVPALLRLRDLLIRLEKWSEALEAQQRVVKAGRSEQDRPAEARLLVGLTYEVGRQLLEHGHPEKARRYFRGAMKRDRQFLPAYLGLGEALAADGKHKHAGKILRKAYVKTNNIIILLRLEELYLDLGEPGEIIRVYQEAMQGSPQDSALPYFLGKLYYRLEMIEEAFHLLSGLEGPPEKLEEYHAIMANLYLRKQQKDRAIEELQKALAVREGPSDQYICASCGLKFQEWSGRCHQCRQWNTYVALASSDNRISGSPQQNREPVAPASPYRGIASPFETI